MYNQEEYIYQEFIANYTDVNARTIIYGIGINTEKLLPRIDHYNILGLMDGKLKSGSKYGYSILDYDEVKTLKADRIIIIARPAVIGMIYHRISQFAAENHIFVGDVHGNDLSVIYSTKENDIPYFKVTWQDLEAACEEYDVISFDIFDTLLVRQTFNPSDIFKIVQAKIERNTPQEVIENYASIRQQAEGNLYKRGINPKLDQIYDEIQELVQCDEITKEKYKKAELDTEIQFIKPRKSMVDFFNKIKNKKQINLISDMYFTRNIIEHLLNINGIEGYHELYVSCEYKISKTAGLFEKYVDDDKAKRHSLHIGDNDIADIASAEQSGLKTFKVMSGKEMLENSSYHEIIDGAETILDNIVLGLICNDLFDDPFALYGSKGLVDVRDYKSFARTILAPEIIYFTCWLIKQFEKDRCDYILFPSRDAYLLQKIYRILIQNQDNQEIDNTYFYVSRKALYRNSVFDIVDLKTIANCEYHASSIQLFKDRFNVCLNEPDTETLDRGYVNKLIEKYADLLLGVCKEERESYLKYVDTLSIEQKERIAFIDFVAAGSVQNGLQKILPDLKIQGYYFLKRDTDNIELENRIKVKSFYKPMGDFELSANIYKYYLFFEMILTSPDPTFDRFSEKMKPEFIEETRNKMQQDVVGEIQNQILQVTEKIAKLHPDLFSNEFNSDFPDKIVGLMGKESSTISNEEVKLLVLADEYFAKSFNIFDCNV